MSNNRQKCCSFCRKSGHYVSTCNSNYLRDFESLCLQAITLFNDNVELNFRNYLLTEYFLATDRFYLRIAKSFTIRYCKGPTRSNVNICINYLLNYFKPIIQFRVNLLREQINNNSVINEDLLQQVTNFISNSANVMQENNSIAMMNALLFMDMIMSIHEISKNKKHKFNIKMDIKKDINEDNEICECNICYEENKNINFVKFDCGHKFCKDCVKNSLQNEKRENYCCAFCRKEIKNFNFAEETIMNEFNQLIT